MYKKTRKKLIIGSIVLLGFILLIPRPIALNDGGTIEFKAIIYKITKVHKLVLEENASYQDGIKIELFGKEIFTDVK